jgi:effector-binding domain-containing protein
VGAWPAWCTGAAFDGLGETWGRLQAWIREQDLTPGEALWEVYLTEPRPDMDPDELRTLLCWSVA